MDSYGRFLKVLLWNVLKPADLTGTNLCASHLACASHVRLSIYGMFLLCLSSWADSFKRPNSSVGLSSASCTPGSERHRWARVSYHKKVGKSEWKRWCLSDHKWYQRKNSSASWLSILQVFPMFSPWFRHLGTAPTDGSFGRNQGVPMPSLFTPGQFHLMLCLTAGHLILNEQHIEQ